MTIRRVLAVGLVVAGCSGVPPSRPDSGFGGGITFDPVGGGSTAGGSAGGNSAGGNAAGGSSAGGSAVGGGSSATDGGLCTVEARARTLTHLHASFSTNTGSGVRPGGIDSSRRLFTLPSALSPSLRRIPVIALQDAGTALQDGGSRAVVTSLQVEGTPIIGDLTAAAFDETSGVLTGIYLSDAVRVSLVQLSLVGDRARVTTLTQTNAVDAGSYLLQTMHGTSSQLGVQAGNTIATLSIAGTQATWGAQPTLYAASSITAYDRGADRVLSLYDVEFVGGTPQWTPVLQERPSTAARATTIPMTGTPFPVVPTMQPLAPRFMAFDATGRRVLVAGERMATPFNRQVVFEGDLVQRQWREARETNRSITAVAPFVTDNVERQVILPDLTSLSMAPGREFELAAMPLTGALPPRQYEALTSAMLRPEGRVIALSSTMGLLAFDESTSDWARVPARLPTEVAGGASLVWDPVGARVLLLFGQAAGVASSAVFALSADERQFSSVAATGAPPPGRISAGVRVVGRTLVIAGGFNPAGQTLGDVHALDLDTLAWRKVADVTPRRNPALAVGATSVVVVGGESSTGMFVPAVERVELASGTVTPVTIAGTAPSVSRLAPFGSGVAGFQVSTSYGRARWFELNVSETSATWSSAFVEATNQSLSGTYGVEAGCGSALFLGHSSYRVDR